MHFIVRNNIEISNNLNLSEKMQGGTYTTTVYGPSHVTDSFHIDLLPGDGSRLGHNTSHLDCYATETEYVKYENCKGIYFNR